MVSKGFIFNFVVDNNTNIIISKKIFAVKTFYCFDVLYLGCDFELFCFFVPTNVHILFSFDAFNPSQGIGRYANDEWSEPNCLMKRVPVKGEDSLFLYTLTDIQPHSELRYNYGDPSAPWR